VRRVMAMVTGVMLLGACGADAPQDAGSAPAFLANETVAVTRACIASGFDPAATAAALQAQGYARPTPLSPTLAKAEAGASPLTATRIAVPVAGPCEVVVQAPQVRLVRNAMRNALRAEGFARDRAFETEVWGRDGMRLELGRDARPTPRYLPNGAALHLKPMT
jgi:hypothetical protein